MWLATWLTNQLGHCVWNACSMTWSSQERGSWYLEATSLWNSLTAEPLPGTFSG